MGDDMLNTQIGDTIITFLYFFKSTFISFIFIHHLYIPNLPHHQNPNVLAIFSFIER